jgi:uncharacterized protein
MMTSSRIAAVALLSVLVACAPPQLGNLKNIGKESDPTRFYTLTATSTGTQDAAAMPYIVLGVGPVNVADYLDRSQIVVRESSNQLTLAEFDRWAGSPAKEIQRVLVANLANQLGTERIVSYPWKSSVDPEMTVEMTVEKFEYGNGKVWLTASWQVYADNGRVAVAFRRSELSRDSDDDYNAISANLSELTGELTAQIAQAVRASATRR